MILEMLKNERKILAAHVSDLNDDLKAHKKALKKLDSLIDQVKALPQPVPAQNDAPK